VTIANEIPLRMVTPIRMALAEFSIDDATYDDKKRGAFLRFHLIGIRHLNHQTQSDDRNILVYVLQCVDALSDLSGSAKR
jgi:hypothetical protein